jgi:hypothetical protein
MRVVDVSLDELEARRAELLGQLAAVGDFRRGSVSQSFRRCGKANCACARPGHPGHGPQTMWTRRGADGKTMGRALVPGEVDKVRAELDAWHRFKALTDELTAVNEAICEARPVDPPGAKLAGTDSDAGSDGEKGGSGSRSGARSRRRSALKSTG